MAKRKTNNKFWFHVGLLAVLLSAPNATVIKYSVNNMDAFYFNAVRFLLVALIASPALILGLKKFNKANLKSSLKAGIYMTIASICYVSAIKLSQASYVSIITLITPITFILLSAKLTGEKISNRSVAGITLAAIGAMTIVILPIAIKQGGALEFNPLATFLALLNTIVFPLAIIESKKANESGVSMMTLIGISSWIIGLTSLALTLMLTTPSYQINNGAIFGIIYTGLVVALVARILMIVSYEHIGSAITSALAYLETFIAILLPVALLGESLSLEMVVGGILILCGVYVVEYHKSAHHKHHHVFRSH